MNHSEASGNKPTISTFERYLTVWVTLCIVTGILLGQSLPEFFQTIGHLEIANTSIQPCHCALSGS